MPSPDRLNRPGIVARSRQPGTDRTAAVSDPIEACTVLHVDMDAFFAAVEVLDDPALRGRPVIVGGSGARGAVASCTYEARAFGVRSAMASVEARRRCPQAVFVAPRLERYAEVSAQLHRILQAVTPVVEPIGLDEAFLDVSGSRRVVGHPVAIARSLRHQVHEDLHLTCAVGVARSKPLAKLASRRAKAVPPDHRGPDDGVVVVAPDAEPELVAGLPVTAVWGVGRSAAARLAAVGIRTMAELADLDEATVRRLAGSTAAQQLVAVRHPECADPVLPRGAAKSIGHETTLPTDLHDHQAVVAVLADLAARVATRLATQGLAGRTVSVKLRFADRRTVTRSATLPTATSGTFDLLTVARRLVTTVALGGGIRLVGLSVSGLERPRPITEQLVLIDARSAGGVDADRGIRRATPSPASPAAPAASRLTSTVGPGGTRHAEQRWQRVDAAVGAVQQRFGARAVVAGPAVSRRRGPRSGDAS